MPAALAIWDCVLRNASRISLSTMSASSSGSNSAAGLGQSATSPAPGSPGSVAFYTISQFTLNNFASGATVGAVTPIRNFPKSFSFGVSAVYDANSDPNTAGCNLQAWRNRRHATAAQGRTQRQHPGFSAWRGVEGGWVRTVRGFDSIRHSADVRPRSTW